MRKRMKQVWSRYRRIPARPFLMAYLATMGLIALWADRTEVALACVGALLTLSEYGPSDNKGPHTPSAPASDGA